jgi:DNA-binding MarR family transcriptional regulator
MYMQIDAPSPTRAEERPVRALTPPSPGAQVACAELPPAFADCACLRLRKITRRVTQLFDRALEPAGLTATQFTLLGLIEAHDRIAIGALAAEMVTDPTTLTRNLKPLERLGHVAVRPDPHDRRRRTIALTARGRAALRDGVPLWRAAQARVHDAIGAERSRALKAALDAALASLERA